jgi:hypothetical protein
VCKQKSIENGWRIFSSNNSETLEFDELLKIVRKNLVFWGLIQNLCSKLLLGNFNINLPQNSRQAGYLRQKFSIVSLLVFTAKDGSIDFS